jgi:hypothetical protein
VTHGGLTWALAVNGSKRFAVTTLKAPTLKAPTRLVIDFRNTP